jgi:hypothetical protein
MIVCSHSAFFLATYRDSFFSRFIGEERALLGKPSATHQSVPAGALRAAEDQVRAERQELR